MIVTGSFDEPTMETGGPKKQRAELRSMEWKKITRKRSSIKRCGLSQCEDRFTIDFHTLTQLTSFSPVLTAGAACLAGPTAGRIGSRLIIGLLALESVLAMRIWLHVSQERSLSAICWRLPLY
jgi:hypothetical protein